MPATRTLPESTHDAIEQTIEKAVDDEPTILWWDDGGYLRSLVKSASTALGCDFHAAEQPLELRAEPVRERTVWYVPQPRHDDTDWFRDVENTGGVIKAHIGTLAARCFENDPQAASLRTAYEDTDERETVAKTLYEGLDGDGGLPTLQRLQTQIVLEGHDDPVQFVLEHRTLPDDRDDLLQLRDLLVSNGVPVEGETDERSIVERTRKWAVAEWLVDEGLDDSLLPDEYRPSGSGTFSVPELQSVLNKTERAGELAAVYLDPEGFWHEVLRTIEEPWGLADCPVDASLEHRLWEEWRGSYRAGEYETCRVRAEQRHTRLEATYGDVPWTAVWRQAIDVAALANELETWDEHGERDIVSLYGDVEDGTWQIDSAVFNLIISGEPETDLPEEHPATATLDGLRESLVEKDYLDYLSELGNLVVEQVEAGSPFVEEQHAHQFFSAEEEFLQSGESVALFIVDALRFDLAHELAASIRGELPRMEVKENTWVGTLPSDTKFGKAALTPGSKFSFGIELREGELIAQRNGRPITNHRRRRLFEDDGWSYIMQDEDDETGWSNDRVVYYWNDIDKTGEGELTNFESLFSDRVEAISRIIREKLGQGAWDRAYVLSDHGFVSLPQRVDINDIHPPDGYERVTRRWVAGVNLDDSSGVRLDESAHLGYLDRDAKINILADPIQRFRNQGLPDARFYHGGILPQEFVLNFITITEE